MRVYVCTTIREFMFCDVLKAALRAAQHHPVADLDSDPIHAVITPVAAVEEGCRVISQIVSRRPSAAVVALGHHCTDLDIVSLVEAGAKAYVDRDQTLAQLLFTIDAVVRKRAPASARLTAHVIRKIQRFTGQAPPAVRTGVLTQREQGILDLIVRGCSNKQIADDLAISSNTVKNHVHRVLEKLQVRGRREAARMALRPSTPAAFADAPARLPRPRDGQVRGSL
jgi:two-component system, NarL family, nitrate/nitrite response regulator NarL